jgi:hypothetical protein
MRTHSGQESLRLQSRRLHQTSLLRLPRKDSQDKDSINTEATEYTKSGTDDGAAAQEEAAFDPNNTSPEGEMKKAGEGNEVSFGPFICYTWNCLLVPHPFLVCHDIGGNC